MQVMFLYLTYKWPDASMNTNQSESVALAEPKPERLGIAIPLEELGSGSEVDRAREGALLEVVCTPWGLEFYVRQVGKR